MTKEELIAENASLKEKVEALEVSDKIIREQVSRCLGSVKRVLYAYDEERVVTLDWSQIFFELGKLKQVDLEVSNVNARLDRIDRKIEELFNAMEIQNEKEKD